MTDDYSLTCYAAFPGRSAETQASFETITFLAGKINELGLTSVITIDGSDSKIANTVINETQPKHLNILTLDSMQSITSKDIENGFTYLSVMENNLENIKDCSKLRGIIMPQLECRNLSLGYDSKAIVSDLNFSINKGDYLCIVGENGSGKTTLMKTLFESSFSSQRKYYNRRRT